MLPILILLILLNLLLPRSAQPHAETDTLRRSICLCGRTPAFDISSPSLREWNRLHEEPKHLDPNKAKDLTELIKIKELSLWLFVPPPAAIRDEEISAYYYRFDYYVEKLNQTFTLEASCHEDFCLRPKMVARRICGRFDKTRNKGGKVARYGHLRHKMCYTIRWKPDLDYFRFDAEKREVGLTVRPKENDAKTNETCGKECGERFGLDAVRGPLNWWSAVDVWKSEDNSQWVLTIP